LLSQLYVVLALRGFLQLLTLWSLEKLAPKSDQKSA
jgi:hypothetical protein